MKKILLPVACFLMIACNNENKEDSNAANRDANVENHSGENVSPQLENEGDDRMNVDTISSSNEAKNQGEDDNLHK